MDENTSDIGHTDLNIDIYNINNNKALENISRIVFISLLMIVGIPGNITALLVYFRKFKPSTYRAFVLSLAIVDLAERGIVKFVSHMAHKFRKECPNISAFLDILAACFLSWPAAVIYGKRSFKTNVGYINGIACSVSDDFVNTKYPAYFRFAFGFVLFVSLMALTILYSLIGKQIFRMKKTGFGMNQLQISQEYTVRTQTIEFHSVQANKKEEYLDRGKKEYSPDELDAIKSWNKRRHKTIRITRVVFVITVVLVCSFLTPSVLSIITALDKTFPQNLSFPGMAAYRTFQWTFFISNVANPVIYGFCDKKFMEEICRFYISLSGIWLTRK